MELRRHSSQTHQRHSLLRRQFHQSSRPQSHYRVSTPIPFRFPRVSFLLFQFRHRLFTLSLRFFFQEMHAHRDSLAFSSGLAGSSSIPFHRLLVLIIFIWICIFFGLCCLLFSTETSLCSLCWMCRYMEELQHLNSSVLM